MNCFLLVVIALIALLIIWSIIEQGFFQTSSYNLIYNDFNNKTPLNFILLADLHNSSFGKNNIKLIKKIDEIKPDFILIAGDMVIKNQLSMPSNAYTLLNNLSKRYKIYYGYGNHEQKLEELVIDESPTGIRLYNSWMKYKSALLEDGVIFLNNKTLAHQESSDKEDKNLRISGLTIDLKYFKPFKEEKLEENYLNNLIGHKDKSNFDIVIAHNPLYFPDYAKWGADLVVSGHVHGGIVRLPFLKGIISPQVKLFPSYDGGEYSLANSKMILSRGLGSHSLMLRVFNKAELIKITLAGE